jgi:hypothetical protein
MRAGLELGETRREMPIVSVWNLAPVGRGIRLDRERWRHGMVKEWKSPPFPSPAAHLLHPVGSIDDD